MSDAAADGEHEDRGRAVQHVAGSDLLRTGLQERGARIARPAIVPQDAEDGADAAAHVEIRGAVERIEQHAVAPFAVRRLAQDHGLLVLLRSHDGDAFALGEEPEQHLVRDHIELLLLLALHVLGARGTQHVVEPGAAHLRGDHLRRDGQRGENPRERPRRLGKALMLLQDVSLQGDEGAGRVRAGFSSADISRILSSDCV